MALAVFALSACTPVTPSGVQPDKVSPVPSPSASPVTASSPAPIGTPAIGGDAVERIKTIAGASSCKSVNFKNRGTPPIGYLKGVALVYARAVCNPSWPIVKLYSAPPSGDDAKDALTHYGISSGDYMKQTFTLLIGLGMRESSGKYCCGRDMSADFSSADSAEAGAFQTSWGARRVSAELPNLFLGYSNPGSPKCFLDVFKAGVGTCSDSNLKNWGDGDGAKFQALSKSCPAFATEYAAVLVRKLGGSKGEFGPLRRKEAEISPSCASMLSDVQAYIQANPKACESL